MTVITRPASTRRRPSKAAKGRTTTRSGSKKRKPLAVTAAGRRLSALIGLLVLGMTLFGLVMVMSASSVASVHEFESGPLYQFRRQALWAGLGALAYFASRRFDYRTLQPLARPLLAFSTLLLVLVLIPGIGRELNGSRRWLGVGSFAIQPSEIVKLTLIVFLADLLTRRAKQMHRPDLTVRPAMVVLGLVTLLLMLQPKLGTAIILSAITLLMLFVAGARLTSLAAWATLAVVACSVLAYAAPYRRARLLAFLDPWADPLGSGLQIIQSQVGIASGGLLGVGLGAGTTKWGFLPYAQSDFIFAIVAEEVGLIGAGALIVAFLLLGLLGARTALRAPDRFGMLLAAGITSWLLIQAFLNIGMAMGLLPITGEPLPFVSVGGSSLVMTLAAVGLLSNIAGRARAT